MAGLVTSGIGSGLDLDSMVRQLVTAEGSARAARLTTREAGFQAKLSGFGSFRSALDSLKNALQPLKDLAKFQGRAVTVGDSKILTVTAGGNAAPSSYDIEVERLASAQRLTSAAHAASDTVVGTGTLQLTVGGKAFNVVIDSTSNT